MPPRTRGTQRNSTSPETQNVILQQLNTPTELSVPLQASRASEHGVTNGAEGAAAEHDNEQETKCPESVTSPTKPSSFPSEADSGTADLTARDADWEELNRELHHLFPEVMYPQPLGALPGCLLSAPEESRRDATKLLDLFEDKHGVYGLALLWMEKLGLQQRSETKHVDWVPCEIQVSNNCGYHCVYNAAPAFEMSVDLGPQTDWPLDVTSEELSSKMTELFSARKGILCFHLSTESTQKTLS